MDAWCNDLLRILSTLRKYIRQRPWNCCGLQALSNSSCAPSGWSGVKVGLLGHFEA